MAGRNTYGVSEEVTSDKRASSTVASVLKATNLIECFAQSGTALAGGYSELTLGELVRLSGYPISTVHRLLATLEQAGWVIRRRGGYGLSLRIAEIASHILTGIDLREEARPLMQQLCRNSKETTYLVMRQEDHAVCVERVEGDRMVRVMAWDVGSVLPLHTGAGPMALLAFENPSEIERLLSSDTLLHANGRPVSPSVILERLRVIRHKGWSFSLDETFEGIASIGAPVFGRNGLPIAAISMGGLSTGFKSPRRDELADMLLAVARRLSGMQVR